MLDIIPFISYLEGMNKLPLHKRVMILSLLVEGSSMRSISRTVGVSINTVTKLLTAGTARSIQKAGIGRISLQEVQNCTISSASGVDR